MAFLAAFATLILAVTKGIAGYFYGSEILITDAFHSGADIMAIFASGFGLWLASKKKTTRFPYGFFKAETLVTFIIGLFIIWVGIEMVKNGYHKIFHVEEVKGFPFVPMAVSFISIVAAFFIAKKEKAVGRMINSQSLLINAQESFLDIFISTVVLAGILFAFLKILYVEGTVIILIALLILKLGIENAWASLLVLMDANLDPELRNEIEKKINEIYGVKGTGEVNIRESGPFKMVECKIYTSPTLPLYRAHELADKTEALIMTAYEDIESVFIHVEPTISKEVSALIPVKDINGLDSKVFGHFGRAPYYIIVRFNEEETKIEDFYYNEYLDEKKHIGIKVIRAVIGHKLDMLFTSQIGEISFYMLKDNFVNIYKIQEDMTVREIIKRYQTAKLEEITVPTHTLEESQISQ